MLHAVVRRPRTCGRVVLFAASRRVGAVVGRGTLATMGGNFDASAMSVKELKAYLSERGVSMVGVTEKSELVSLAAAAEQQDANVVRHKADESTAPLPRGVVSVGDTAAWTRLHAAAGARLVVVDFTAAWCGPCRQMAPKFEALAKEHADDVYFLKVDVDDCQDIAAEHGVSCMPTFQLFKAGKKVDELQGADEASLARLVEKHK